MRVKVNAMSLAVLIRQLSEGPCAYYELAEGTGLHYNTVREWVKALHKQHVLAIAGWDTDARGRRSVALWRIDIDGRDVKRPHMTPAERSARYRERKKQAALLGLLQGQ